MSIVPCGCAIQHVVADNSSIRRCAPTRPLAWSEHMNVESRSARFCRSAADAVTSLNVDPGGYRPNRARSISSRSRLRARLGDAARFDGFVRVIEEARERIAADGEQLAGVRVDHHCRGMSGRRARRVLRQDARHRACSGASIVSVHVARAVQKRLHLRVARRVAVTQQRNQLAIVSPNRRGPDGRRHLAP